MRRYIDFTKIKFPKCYCCGAEEEVFKCSSCLKYTCTECFKGLTSDGCVHFKAEHVVSTGW